VLLKPPHDGVTGTERFERVVLGSLSKVTRPRNWTAVDITRMRERSDVAPAKPYSFSPAKSGVRANQDEGAILTGHLVD
jgi:hypothetical protein